MPETVGKILRLVSNGKMRFLHLYVTQVTGLLTEEHTNQWRRYVLEHQTATRGHDTTK